MKRERKVGKLDSDKLTDEDQKKYEEHNEVISKTLYIKNTQF